MKLFKIKNKFTDNVIFSLECQSIKMCLSAAITAGADLREANLSGADLREADLSEANLSGADLREADLWEANLRGADLWEADLREADLREANLRRADLREANLRGAHLRGADLDFACWPFHCGSFEAKADDRLVAQLLHHVAKLDISECSGPVKESVEFIRKMAISDLFCEYRPDVTPIEE